MKKSRTKKPSKKTSEKHVKITKNMTISEILDIQPAAMEILLNTGLHCIGCGASYYESLEDGMKVHGFTDNEIDDIVQQLNS